MDPASPEPWQWEEATWRGHAEAAQAGRSLAPRTWPGEARVAVALSFDADHETPALRDGKTSPGLLSQGAYGARAGVPRILDLLAKRAVPATFFVPAVSALLHPDDVRSFVDRGHEVAMHGWIHESNLSLTASAERDLALRAADTWRGWPAAGRSGSAHRLGTSARTPWR